MSTLGDLVNSFDQAKQHVSDVNSSYINNRNLALSTQTVGQTQNSQALAQKYAALPVAPHFSQNNLSTDAQNYLTRLRSWNPFVRNNLGLIKDKLFGTPAQQNALYQAQTIHGNELSKNPVYSVGKSAALGLTNAETMGTINALQNNSDIAHSIVSDTENAQKAHPITYNIGQLVGYAVPGSAVDTGIHALAKPLIAKAAGSIAGRIGTEAALGALSNGALSAIPDIAQGNNASDTAKDVALNAAFGGVLGGAGKAIAESGLLPKFTAALKDSPLANEASDVKPPEAPVRGITSQVTNDTAKAEIPLADAALPQADKTVNDFVNTDKIPLTLGKNDRQTTAMLRQAYAGKQGLQEVTGAQLNTAMQKIAPKEQEAISVSIDSSPDRISQILSEGSEKHPWLDEKIPNSSITYRDAYEGALNLSPKAQQAADMAKQYYSEAAEYSKGLGTIGNIRENYANRLYQQPKNGVKTEVFKSGISPYTSHGKQRVFDYLDEALDAGKTPATLNAGDLLGIHNQEMARANTNAELRDTLYNGGHGVGHFTTESAPKGWTAIDSLGKSVPIIDKDGNPQTIRQNFILPDHIAKGLKAITDPDEIKQNKILRSVLRYNGLAKTFNLSYSLFHPISLAAQAIYNFDPIQVAKNIDKFAKLDTDGFNAMERFGTKYGLTTDKMMDNLDVVRKLNATENLGSKVANLPVIKQVIAGNTAIGNATFGKMQRWLKVTDFNIKAASWAASHADATTEEATKALRSLATEVNSAYGGLNWKALGVTKGNQSLMRLMLLAPDWTSSSALMAGQAFTKSAGGTAARMQYVRGIGLGLGLLEGLNILFTGHGTDKNPAGHELQIEVAPGIYVSPFRSGLGDIAKLVGNVAQSGVIGGLARSAQSKTSPLVRTLIGELTNTDYNGAPIRKSTDSSPMKDLSSLKYAFAEGSPLPFGASSAYRYNKETPDTGTQKAIGNLLVDTGIGTYAKDKTQQSGTFNNPQKSYANNWIFKFGNQFNTQAQAEQKAQDQIKALTSSSTANSKAAKQYAGQQIAKGTNENQLRYALAAKYGLTDSQAKTVVTNAQKGLQSKDYSTLTNSFMALSKANRKKLYYSSDLSTQTTIRNSLGNDGIDINDVF